MYRMSYYPWLTQNVDQRVIHSAISHFASLVSEELRSLRNGRECKVVVLEPVDVPKQVLEVAGGNAEIALMNPLGFVFARQLNREVEALAVAQRIINGKVGVWYYSQLYARRDSGIAKLHDLRDKTIGYGYPYSTSNFLFPALLLKNAGLHPVFSFQRIEFLKGHETVARAVYTGKIAIGAGHDGVITDLAGQPGFEDANETLTQIEKSAPIPSDPIACVLADARERRSLQTALVNASNTPEGKSALEKFWGNAQGLAVTSSGAYEPVGEALRKLNLVRDDIMCSIPAST